MSEEKLLQEKHYLRRFVKQYIKQYPYLADVLDQQDPQSGHLLEGFAFLSARLQEKIDDAFPEIALPLLQRLQSRAIKGIPATTIVQFDKKNEINFSIDIKESTELSDLDQRLFSTCNELQLQPISVIKRNVTHHPNKSCLSLRFNYRGNIKEHITSALTLFLDNNCHIASTLLLWLCQYFDRIELEHCGKYYQGDSTTFNFEPMIGERHHVLQQANNAKNAPQTLLEGLYIDHIHHFITLNIPTIIDKLNWENSTEFTVNIYLNKQLPLSDEALSESFLINCVTAVNKEHESAVIVEFVNNKSVYLLPIPENQCLTQLQHIELSYEPHEDDRGIMVPFYPITQLTPSARLLPKYQSAYFYSLDIENTILDENNYLIHFFNNKGEAIVTPPGKRFSCTYTSFDYITNGKENTLTHINSKLPDVLTVENITKYSKCYPPITNDKYYWSLLSHYSANGFMLSSVDSIKQMIHDYILYQDSDRQISAQLLRYLEGLVEIDSYIEDRLLKGKPYRCLALKLTLDLSFFENAGSAFLFTMHMHHFFPFCLSENMLLKTTVTFTDSNDIWYLAPSLLKGYKSLI